MCFPAGPYAMLLIRSTSRRRKTNGANNVRTVGSRRPRGAAHSLTSMASRQSSPSPSRSASSSTPRADRARAATTTSPMIVSAAIPTVSQPPNEWMSPSPKASTVEARTREIATSGSSLTTSPTKKHMLATMRGRRIGAMRNRREEREESDTEEVAEWHARERTHLRPREPHAHPPAQVCGGLATKCRSRRHRAGEPRALESGCGRNPTLAAPRSCTVRLQAPASGYPVGVRVTRHGSERWE